MSKDRPKRREVKIVHPSYQPNRAELREDLRVDATFEKGMRALVQHVKVKYVPTARDR